MREEEEGREYNGGLEGSNVCVFDRWKGRVKGLTEG